MSEHTIPYQEAPALNPAEQRLAAVLTMPDELKKSFGDQFEAELAQLVAIQPTKERQDIVRQSAALLRWECLAQPGEPLPTHYEAVYFGTGSTNVTFNIDSAGFPLPSNAHEYVISHLPSFTNYFAHFLQEPSKQTLSNAVAGVIRSQPHYTFLSSFGISVPQQAEAPLSPAIYARRVREIEEQTSRRFGLPSSQFLYDPNANQYYKRSSLHLSLETEQTRQPAAPTTDVAFEHFNGWLLERIQENIGTYLANRGQQAPKGIVAGVRPVHSPDSPISNLELYTDRGEIVPDAISIIRNALDSVAMSFGKAQPYEMQSLANNLLPSFTHMLYDGMHGQFAETLHAALEMQTEAAIGRSILPIGRQISDSILVCLRRPQSQLRIAGYTSQERSRSIINDPLFAVTVASKAEIDKEKARVIGALTERSKRAMGMRLITNQTAKNSYPTKARSYDVQLELTDQAIIEAYEAYGAAPASPGMEVVARKENVWYFALTEHDPYQGSDRVPIAAEHKAALAQRYKDIGMHELAAVLEHHEGILSVAGLVKYVQSNTHYTYDINLSPESPPQAISDFAAFVVNGRLHAQCSGSSTFMAATLRTALPGCALMPVHGYTMPAGRDITASQHEQLSYVYDNQLYIVDATAVTEGATTPAENVERHKNTPSISDIGHLVLKHTRRAISSVRPPSPGDAPAPTAHSQNRMTAEEMHWHNAQRLAAQNRQLEQSLQSIFKAKDQEALYKKLAALNADDPNRIVVTAFYQAQQNNWQTLQQAHATLQGYLSLEAHERDTVLRQYHIPNYSNSHLELLAEQLDAAIRFAPHNSRS